MTKIKHASHSMEQMTKGIAAIQLTRNHTTILAHVNQLLRQNYRRKDKPVLSNQITLGEVIGEDAPIQRSLFFRANTS